jgi:hypothetical protein
VNESTATGIRLSAIEKRCDKKEAITLAHVSSIAKLEADSQNLKEWMAEYEQKFNDRIDQISTLQVHTSDLIANKDKDEGRSDAIYSRILSLEAFKNKQIGYMALLVVIVSLVWDALKDRILE